MGSNEIWYSRFTLRNGINFVFASYQSIYMSPFREVGRMLAIVHEVACNVKLGGGILLNSVPLIFSIYL